MMAALYRHTEDLARSQRGRASRSMARAGRGEIGMALTRLIHGARGRLAPEAAMPGMKITLDAAMRVRDVSQPRPDHEAAALAADAQDAARPGGAGAARPGTVQGSTVQGSTVQGGTVQGGTVQGGTVQGGTVQGG